MFLKVYFNNEPFFSTVNGNEPTTSRSDLEQAKEAAEFLEEPEDAKM